MHKIKILDGKNKSNQTQCDMCREAAKISTLSSKNYLNRYEYLTGEDLGFRPKVFEKAKFEYSSLGMSLSKACTKDEIKSVAKSKSDFNYDNNDTFSEFGKRIDEFKDMPLGSKYAIRKNFNKNVIKFKNPKLTKSETRLKKERIRKNVEKVYRKYYDTYNDKYDNGGELGRTENKHFHY